MKSDNQRSNKTLVILVLFAILFLITTSVLSNYLNPSLKIHEIRLESTKLSELDVDHIINEITDITGAKSSNIIMQNFDSKQFKLTNDFRWGIANNFDILVSMSETGKEPYIYYKLDIKDENNVIHLYNLGGEYEQKAPKKYISFNNLLYALKYIPVDEISNYINKPDGILIVLEATAPNDENPRIYYNQFGIAEEIMWILRLDIYPMYYKEHGGLHTTGDKMIHLFYVGQ